MACSTLTSLVPRDPSVVLESLIENQQYELALRHLEHMTEGNGVNVNTGLRAEKIRIGSLICNYETAIIGKASAEFKRNDIAAALDELKAALKNIPSSQILKDYQQTLNAEQGRRLQHNKKRLLVERSRFLLKQRELFTEQTFLQSPSLTTQWRMMRNERLLNLLKEELLDCGHEALEQQRFSLAEDCLQLAHRIKADDTTQEAIDYWRTAKKDKKLQFKKLQFKKRYKRRIKGKKDEILIDNKKKRIFDQQKRIEQLRQEVHMAMAKQDLMAAHRSLSLLLEEEGETQELTELLTTLNQSIEASVEVLLKEASQLYRSGSIEEAQEVWQNVLQLDPENDTAASNLERAERVLVRLRELRGNNSL